ncbi:hypothetical protein HPB50_010024 [Hyalomma asiaticum]|uniref:Uncharacterized protein n=1 Tax=Hyalomma asiaticum TaxID=266040 RepID=A0ACB7SUF3_HYAAI|nr:hypothetical protein HPB50_010024 [Hyalomma asiaticum]
MSVLIDGKQRNALVDSGASITVINANIVDSEKIQQGRPVEVHGYNGRRDVHDKWTSVSISRLGNSVAVQALVLDGVPYKLLISSPAISALRLNVYWTGEVTIEEKRHSVTAS